MVKIGNIELRNQIVAAPLAGISNPVYREIMHDYGAGLVVRRPWYVRAAAAVRCV